mmetsp:Transcript_10327/g.18789  ORF Transcript_10327/g.18789 Transcript_10327/m.18789 type:complete len:89 (+) Transcript_10327:1906-2172(+)
MECKSDTKEAGFHVQKTRDLLTAPIPPAANNKQCRRRNLAGFLRFSTASVPMYRINCKRSQKKTKKAHIVALYLFSVIITDRITGRRS